MSNSENKLFALNLYKIEDTCLADNKHVEYSVLSQVVFFSSPDANHARVIYSEFLEEGWCIGAIMEVPPREHFQKPNEHVKVCV